MATLNKWRVLYADNKPFLAALDVIGHPLIMSGPIITSPIIAGNPIQGETVQTKSGTLYTLEAPLPKEEDCEFARGLLVERASKYFSKQGRMLTLQQLEDLYPIIDRILARE